MKSPALEMLDRLFGECEELIAVTPDLKGWLTRNGFGHVSVDELLEFARKPCGGCGGEDGALPELLLIKDDSVWAWCNECYLHSQYCYDCGGPSKVVDTFYLSKERPLREAPS